MSFYQDIEDYEQRGIDTELYYCLQYNPQDFSLEDIDRVVAVSEGEGDGDPWQWVILLKDGRYIALEGWCDYTGWDCRSGAENTVHMSAPGAALSFGNKEARQELLLQIFEGKDQTWREKMDKEFVLV